MKKLLTLLMWTLIGLALIFFIGIFVFAIKEDRENAFISMILGWASYFASWGVNILKTNLFGNE